MISRLQMDPAAAIPTDVEVLKMGLDHDWPKLRSALQKGGSAELSSGSTGMTLLLMVTQYSEDDLSLVESLVSRGANPSSRSNKGWSVLLLAVAHDRPKIASWALKHGGASIMTEMTAGKKTALHWAAFHNRKHFVTWIFEQIGHSSFLELLDMKDAKNQTALDCARKQGHDKTAAEIERCQYLDPVAFD